ncbi:MAG: 4-hydroxy-tetrahydrodipicolinate reductase [Ostreibacterium sp.]
MLKVAIAGINGRMGRTLYSCLQETQFPMVLSVATTSAGNANVGKIVSEVLGGDSTVIISDVLSRDFDVLIDFTTVASTLSAIKWCKKYDKGIVIGTTGFSEVQLSVIHEKAKQQPIFMSANMSIGINIMEQLVAIAAKALHQQADIEIVEAHHKHKIDAPSGTALMIGRAIADSIGVDLSEKGVFSRQGITGEREDGSIGFSTIRGGNVVGEHTAYYYMADECIEISHRATDRKVFANGALFAANYLSKKRHGLYNMFDALGL